MDLPFTDDFGFDSAEMDVADGFGFEGGGV